VYAFINGAANAPYAMSKAAVESFGRSLRAEMAGTGVTAGVLYPGWVDTPIIRASHQEDTPSRQLIDLLMPKPLRTPVSPQTVAAAVVHGIERRKPRIVVPRRWAPTAAARGIVNIATDAVIDHYPRVHNLLQQL
jgi:short-subunit dehydrogenase